MIEVIVDTNVLVAAFRSSLGASYALLQTLEQRRWRPVISLALALEYENVLKHVRLYVHVIALHRFYPEPRV